MTTETVGGDVDVAAAEAADRADPVGKPEEFQPAPTQSPRSEMLKRIARQAEHEQGHDTGVMYDDSGDEPKLVRVAPSTSKPDEDAHLAVRETIIDETGSQPAPVAEVIEPVAAPIAAQPKIKLKVDGRELEVDEDAVRNAGIATLQKETAADLRLREASALLAEAQALRERAHQNAAPPKRERDELGEEPETAQPEQQPAVLDQRALDQRVRQVAAATVAETTDFNAAIAQLEIDLPDIKTSPIVQQFAATEERRLRLQDTQRGVHRKHVEVYKEVAANLKAFRGGPVPIAQKLEERAAIKAAAPAAVAGAAAPAAKPTTPRPLTVQQQIAKERDRRIALQGGRRI